MVAPWRDVALISHAHYDHLDLPSPERLGKELPLVVPRGLGATLRKRRFESVLEVEVGETLRIGELEILVVPAEHDGSRRPLGRAADAVGYTIAGSRSVYVAGDTDLFDGMSEIGPVDVGLIPIWGWGPALGPGHLDPSRAAEALVKLRPRVAIPLHWGTYSPLPPESPARARLPRASPGDLRAGCGAHRTGRRDPRPAPGRARRARPLTTLRSGAARRRRAPRDSVRGSRSRPPPRRSEEARSR